MDIISRYTWIDSFVKPERGTVRIVICSIAAAALSLLPAFVLFYYYSSAHLITERVFIASALGVFWVCIWIFLIPLHRKLIESSPSFLGGTVSPQRQFERHAARNWLHLLVTFLAWLAILPLIFSDIRAALDLPVNSLTLLEEYQFLDGQRLLIFKVALSISLLIAGAFAVTAGALLTALIYFFILISFFTIDNQKPMQSVRSYFEDIISVTVLSGFGFSSGIVMVILGVGLDFLSFPILPILCFVIILSVSAIVTVALVLTRMYARHAAYVHDKLLTDYSKTDAGNRLIQEMAWDCAYRLRTPLVNFRSLSYSTISAISPLLLLVVKKLAPNLLPMIS